MMQTKLTAVSCGTWQSLELQALNFCSHLLQEIQPSRLGLGRDGLAAKVPVEKEITFFISPAKMIPFTL